jgi:hypothetical protein
VRTWLFAVVCLALSIVPAFAEVWIKASPGGDVNDALNEFLEIRASGERVAIDGPCLSACTLVLSVVPHDRICVTPRAILGFHAAREVDEAGRIYPARRATRLIMETYPPPIRSWIRRHGGLTGRLLLLRGRELASYYPRCG